MRGSRSIQLPFNFEETEPQGRGRSEVLINRRDVKLYYRYYYHTYHQRMRFDETIKQLSLEFDIAERTITDRMQKNNDVIARVFKRNPSVGDLKKKYPYFSWS